MTTECRSRLSALRAEFSLIIQLRDDERCYVVNPEPRLTHNVYVVELSPEVLSHKKVRKRNPDRDQSKPCVYVGETSKEPEVRLKEHLNGGVKSSWAVEKYGMRLLPALYERWNPRTEMDALELERHLARRLRREGYTVLGGH